MAKGKSCYAKLLTALAVGVAANAFAATEKVGSYTWTYRMTGNGAEICRDGTAAAISPSPTGAVAIPSTLGGKPVTSIGDFAFTNYAAMTAVTIPNSVTNIGEGAFEDCTGLASMTIPRSVVTLGGGILYNCTNITALTLPFIPDGDSISYNWDDDYWDDGDWEDWSGGYFTVHTLYRTGLNYVFCRIVEDEYSGYSLKGSPQNLKSITLSEGCLDVPEYSFYPVLRISSQSYTSETAYKLHSLSSVTIPNSVTNIGKYAFYRCEALKGVSLGSGVKTIGEGAFEGCVSLSSMTIPSGVTALDAYLFKGCKLLKSVKLPAGVRCISSSAFSGCSAMASINIPQGMEWIGSGAFNDCSSSLFDTSSIKGVLLVDGWVAGYTSELSGKVDLTKARDMVDEAFADCGKLTDIKFPKGIKCIQWGAFSECSGLKSVTIPAGVEKIADNAFSQCQNLASVKFPDGIREIGTSAFEMCGKLGAVKIPNSATRIESFAFDGCSGLKSLTLSSKLKYIGFGAFRGCTSLSSVKIPDKVEEIGVEAFSGCSKLGSVKLGKGLKCLCVNAFAKCASKLYDTSTIKGLKLVDGWVVGYKKKPSDKVDLTGARGIADCAFAGCDKLKKVTLPTTVTIVPDGAFRGCGFTELVIPMHITHIGKEAFAECNGLDGVVVYVPKKTNVGADAFDAGPTIVRYDKSTKFTVEFDAAGGKGGWSKKMKFGAKITAPKVKKTGYKFMGWDKAVAKKVPLGGAAYKAKWKANTYTVKFDKNGGSGAMKDVKCTYGKKFTLPANAFTKANCTFLGWATDKKAKAAAYTNKQKKVKNLAKSGTVTLYAVWKDAEYTVKFFVNDGTKAAKSQTVKVGTKTALAKASKLGIVRAGWEFKGWALSEADAAAGKVKYKDGENVKDLAQKEKTRKLFAVWSLPAWAMGSFYGDCEYSDIDAVTINESHVGTMTVEITSSGALTGTMTWADGNKSVVRSFSASDPKWTASYTRESFKADFLEDDYEGEDLVLADGSCWTYLGVEVETPVGTTEKMDILVANCKVYSGTTRAGAVCVAADWNQVGGNRCISLDGSLAQDVWTNADVKKLPKLSSKQVKTLAVKSSDAGHDGGMYNAGVRKLSFAFADKGAVTVTALDANGDKLDEFAAHLLVDGVKSGKYLCWTPVHFRKLGGLARFGIDIKAKSGAVAAGDITLGFDD